jgi:biopolymer transport protein ExbB
MALVLLIATTAPAAAQVMPPPEPGAARAAPLQTQPGSGLGTPERKPSKTFLQIFFSGGPLGIANMIALIFLSLTAAYLVFDNVGRIRRADLVPEDLAHELHQLVEQGRLNDAVTTCKNRPCLLAAVVQQGLYEADFGWSEVEKAMEDAITEQSARIYRWLEYLSVIANLAPMVGLLGTVTGMLLAFKEVADSGQNAGAADLADGIYQALVTTVYGLVIAIPSLGCFALFRSWVDELVAEAAYAALHILAPLKQRGLGLQAPPVATPKPTIQPPPPPPRSPKP